jgi:hypothetical protein
MFVVSYKEELNGKLNNIWEDEYNRMVEVIEDLRDASEGLPTLVLVSIREFAQTLWTNTKDVEKILEVEKYKITIKVKVV